MGSMAYGKQRLAWALYVHGTPANFPACPCVKMTLGLAYVERKGLSSSIERNRKKKIMEKSEGWWSDEVERLIDARKVAGRKLRGGRYKSTLGQLQKSENRGEEEDLEGEEGIEKEISEEY